MQYSEGDTSSTSLGIRFLPPPSLAIISSARNCCRLRRVAGRLRLAILFASRPDEPRSIHQPHTGHKYDGLECATSLMFIFLWLGAATSTMFSVTLQDKSSYISYRYTIAFHTVTIVSSSEFRSLGRKYIRSMLCTRDQLGPRRDTYGKGISRQLDTGLVGCECC